MSTAPVVSEPAPAVVGKVGTLQGQFWYLLFIDPR